MAAIAWVIGATGAIGAAVAERLRADGAEVFSSARSVAPSATALPLDLTDSGAVQNAADEIALRAGRIDVLVLAVAAPGFGDFLDIADDVWSTVVETKLLGVVRAIRAVLPTMLAAGSGSIVIVTGRGTNPPPRHLPGASVNAALNLLVQGLGARYAPDGVRINAVAPGPIASPRLAAMRADSGSAASRQGSPADVADAVAFLTSERAAFISGTVLVVDGGGARSLPEKQAS